MITLKLALAAVSLLTLTACGVDDTKDIENANSILTTVTGTRYISMGSYERVGDQGHINLTISSLAAVDGVGANAIASYMCNLASHYKWTRPWHVQVFRDTQGLATRCYVSGSGQKK